MKPVHHTIDWLCQPRVDSGAFASFAQADPLAIMGAAMAMRPVAAS